GVSSSPGDGDEPPPSVKQPPRAHNDPGSCTQGADDRCASTAPGAPDSTVGAMSATTTAVTTVEEGSAPRRGPLAELVGRRRRPGSRWSASFSLTATLAGGATKPLDPAAVGGDGPALRTPPWGAPPPRPRSRGRSRP